MTLNDPKVTIAFLGQCHTVGYHGVPPEASFPQICREVVESRRPGTRVDVVVREYQHPTELPNTTSAAMLTRPRIVVIEVVGWLTIRGRESVDLSRLPRGVRSAYQRVRYLRRVSQALLASVPRMTDRKFAVPDNAQKLLGAIVPRQLRAGVPEYEVCIQRAITQVKSVPGTYSVVQGPGAPNLALNARSLASDALERYRAVEAMARRVAAANDALYVDRWDTVTPSFFAPRSVRPTLQGHLLWGHLLADHLLKAGMV